MDVRTKQLLCYQHRPLNFSLRGGGFASHNLNRQPASCETEFALFGRNYKNLSMIRETIQTDWKALLAIVKDSGQFDESRK
jgi:hypothetical protein